MHPDSWKRLTRFVQGPTPRWTWSDSDWQLNRELLLVEKSNTLLLRYVHRGPDALLRLRPMLAFRDMHRLTRENGRLSPECIAERQGVRFQPYPGLPPLWLTWLGSGAFRPDADWYRGFEYPVEAMRGFECHEDLFTPGVLELPIRDGEPVVLAASIENGVHGLAELWAAEYNTRKAEWDDRLGSERSEGLAPLQYHGRHFLVTAKKLPSICAGYPWFSEWGRDAMIALPGLTLYSGREALALEILGTFAEARRDGLIPNYLNADGHHAYNSVDASLWFFAAVQEYLARTGDQAGVKKRLFGAMADILSAFHSGRAPHVQRREDGLLWVGNPDTQLTWMDACVHGRPVTPRHGLAVELNALWYNALQFFLEFCGAARLSAPPGLGECALRAKQSFWKTFSGAPWPWLADTVNERGLDASLRPNQIFAVSLPHSPLTREQQVLVVEAVAAHLVTPVGLRTLAPGDPRYLGRYEGDGASRDRAYHQGTVWPWLVGAYAAARLRTAPDRPAAALELSKTFAPLFGAERAEYGVGGIAEIYDGNAPHRPAGCISQAWSVGEIIRARTLVLEALS